LHRAVADPADDEVAADRDPLDAWLRRFVSHLGIEHV
jgi:hypothetical protein